MLLKCPFGKYLKELRVEVVSNEKTIKAISDFCPNLEKLIINNYRVQSNAFKRIANKCTKLNYLSINQFPSQFVPIESEDSQQPIESDFRLPMDESMKMIAQTHSNLQHLILFNCHLSASAIKLLLQAASKGEIIKTYMKTIILERCNIDSGVVQNICDCGFSLQVVHLVNNPQLEKMVEVPQSVNIGTWF